MESVLNFSDLTHLHPNPMESMMGEVALAVGSQALGMDMNLELLGYDEQHFSRLKVLRMPCKLVLETRYRFHKGQV